METPEAHGWRVLPCAHKYCNKVCPSSVSISASQSAQCIERWEREKSTCPICRANIESGQQPAAAIPGRARTPQQLALLPPSGLIFGAPHTLYVWCTCWRRLVISDSALALPLRCGERWHPGLYAAHVRWLLCQPRNRVKHCVQHLSDAFRNEISYTT